MEGNFSCMLHLHISANVTSYFGMQLAYISVENVFSHIK